MWVSVSSAPAAQYMAQRLKEYCEYYTRNEQINTTPQQPDLTQTY